MSLAFLLSPDMKLRVLKSTPEDLARREEMYYERKIGQRCVGCDVPLSDDAECNTCIDCRERNQLSQAIYRRSPRALKLGRKQKRKQRAERLAAGLCTVCSLPRAEWPEPGPTQKATAEACPSCPPCRRRQQKRNDAYRERVKLGLVTSKAERKRRRRDEARELRRELHGTEYRPIDEKLAKPRIRILRAMRRFEWVEADEIYAAIGAPDHDGGAATERTTLARTITRLAAEHGEIERREIVGPIRKHGAQYEYRLTDAGRAQLAKVAA